MTGEVILMTMVYSLVIVLLIVLIIVGIKTIFVIDNINNNLKEINERIHSFDGFFEFVDGISNSLASINKKMLAKVSSVMNFKNRKKDGKDE